MSTHLTLRIDAATSRKTIIEFLQQTASSDKSGGTSHLRAVEKTYRNKDGSLSTVTKLFVRSGTESPVKWFKNFFNGERQHTLAAKVLQTRLQYRVSEDENPRSDLSSSLSKSSNLLMMAGLKPEYRKAGIPLSAVSDAVHKPAAHNPARTD
jgi:hypothetical protein